MVYFDDIVWLDQYVEKIERKHGVCQDEVEEVLFENSYTRRVRRGHRPGEDVYSAYGQTHAGRYLIIIFIYKPQQLAALPISARDMDGAERKIYAKR